MPTEWFDRSPGDGFIKPTNEAQPDGEQMTILGVVAPDWVRMPDELGPPLAGQELRVVRYFHSTCRLCGIRGAMVLELETDHGTPDNPAAKLHTSECKQCGKFAIYYAEYAPVTDKPAG